MPDELQSKDLGAVWRGQPAEKLAVKMEQFANRRTRELYSTTRSEILMSVGAALLFVAVMELRFASVGDRLQQFGLAAVVGWILISLYWFRGLIWRKSAVGGLAAASLEHYRRELEHRRDHLRNAWIWHGPLVLACLIFLGTIISRISPGRLPSVAPLLILLAIWTAFGIRHRWRQARELQTEIDSLRSLA
jgi:hypothetical protein